MHEHSFFNIILVLFFLLSLCLVEILCRSKLKCLIFSSSSHPMVHGLFDAYVVNP
jgi:hypothetical protein